MKFESILIALLLVSCVAHEGHGDNGAVALAEPVNGITIDGDLADWPDSLAWHSIQRTEFAAGPQSAEDLDARFRVGYDSSGLYVAVEVHDDSTVIDGTPSWDSQDGCSIFLDLEHGEGERSTIQFNIYGDGLPSVGAKTAVATWSCQRTGPVHCYEWRFETKHIASTTGKLEPGRVIGFDISVCDKDQDGSFSWVCWGAGTKKDRFSRRLGDILLVALDERPGTVRGRTLDATTFLPLHHYEIRIGRAEQTSELSLLSDSDGSFAVELPAGDYHVASVSGASLGNFHLEPGGRTNVDLHSLASLGRQTMPALKSAVPVRTSLRMRSLHYYGTHDGLPCDDVRGLTQAGDGSLWIAGSGGLAQFDGRMMTLVSGGEYSPTLCEAIAIDHGGMVWVGSPRGLYRYDGKEFTLFTRVHGLPAGPVAQLVPMEHSLWIRSHHGISRFDGDSFSIVRERTSSKWWLSTMEVETCTRIWLGTTTGLVLLEGIEEDGVTVEWRETRFGSEHGLVGENIRALMVDSAGNLWIGTMGGLTRYDGKNFKGWPLQDGLANPTVNALAETEDGRIWVGTNAGLHEFRDGRFIHIPGTTTVRDLFVDQEQNLWIAASPDGHAGPSSRGSSLIRFNTDRPTYPRIPGEQVTTARRMMRSRDGALWIGTKRGVLRQQGSTTRRYTVRDGLAGMVVNCIFEDSQGNTWIGTNQGVSRFDGRTFASKLANDQPIATQATALAEDERGQIWIGTSEGITLYHPGPDDTAPRSSSDKSSLPGHVSHLTTVDGLLHNGVTSLLADGQGTMWIGTQTGICRWRKDCIENFPTCAQVNCLMRDGKNNLYAGTNGLLKFDGKQWNRIAVCGRARVVALDEGRDRQLWLATEVGLKVYDGFAAQTFTADDGMPKLCDDVRWEVSDAAVLIAGGEVAEYRPSRRPPPIAITNVTADGQHEDDGVVHVASSPPRLGFAFHGTSFKTRPETMLYRYRLRGAEDAWRLTDKTQVSYSQLPSGRYMFEVEAIDRDLTYSDQPAVVQVRIDRDLRQTALWSSLGFAITAVVILGTMVIKRDRGIQRLNVELDQRVKDRTAKLESEVAENRKLQERLLQTQKLDAVGTMASGIAHDFNNSLAVITGFAELAKSESSDSHQLIDHILMAAQQAAGTTKNLLTFSRESPAEKVPYDLLQLVDETSDFLRKMLPASIKLSCEVQQDVRIWCSMDTAHIQQVLVNIAMNARDAMPAGGEIRIWAGEHARRPGFAHLQITDTGLGMPEEVRERIFDPFFTTKSRGRGTGLGMSIVHGIIEDHSGVVEIKSAQYQGTTVSIALPRCAPAESKSDAVEPVRGGTGETILVAEDNTQLQAMIEAQLSSAGYEVLTAEDGLQALDLLEFHESKVRLALLDIDLPRKDGLACLREISAQYPNLPTVLMSGLSSVDPEQLATPFLQKPFDRRTLLQTIGTALRPEPDRPNSGILVIDDDDLVRMSTEAVLASGNFDVFLAGGCDEAVQKLRENSDRISTVLLDWNLPQTDPESVLQELRYVSPTVRVLVVSGDHSLELQQVLAKGFSRLLKKPVSRRELIEAVG